MTNWLCLTKIHSAGKKSAIFKPTNCCSQDLKDLKDSGLLCCGSDGLERTARQHQRYGSVNLLFQTLSEDSSFLLLLAYQRIRGFAFMRYINPRLTLTLTYLMQLTAQWGRTNFVLHHWASRPSPLATRPSGHKKGVFKALILLPNVLNVWMKSDITVVDQDGGNPPRSSSATLEINVEDPDSRIPTFINAPISFFVRENEPSVSYYYYWYKKVSVHRWQSRSGSRQSADGDEQQPLMSAAACQPDTPVTSNIDYKNSSDINYDINRGSLAYCHFIAEIATKLAIRKFV